MKYEEIVRGDAYDEATTKRGGWIMGHFAEGPQKTEKFEVKLWRYDGKIDYGVKAFPGEELIIVEGGKLSIKVSLGEDKTAETIILNGKYREYILLPRNARKEVQVEQSPVWGVTVRWPSAA
jgi:hypothetical protein